MLKRLLLLPALFITLAAHAQSPTLEVAKATPIHGSTGISSEDAVSVSFTFNEPIDSLHHALQLITLVGSVDLGDATLSADKKTVTIETFHEADTDYTWIVAGSYFIDHGCDPELGEQGEFVSMKKPFVLRYTTADAAGAYAVSGTVNIVEGSAGKTGLSVGTLNLGKVRSLATRKAGTQAPAASAALRQASGSAAMPLARTTNHSTAPELEGSLVLLADANNPNPDLEAGGIVAAAVVGADGSYEIDDVRPGTYFVVGLNDLEIGDLLLADLFGLLNEFVIGTYDSADPDEDADAVVITSSSASGIDITMRPASTYAVDMAEAEADAKAFTTASTGEPDPTFLGASTFLVDQNGASAYWTFDYAVPAPIEGSEVFAVIRAAFITYTDESTDDADGLRSLPEDYPTAAEVLATLEADSRVQKFFDEHASATTMTFFLGGDPYLFADPLGITHTDKILWRMTILSLGDDLDVFGSAALVGYVDMETGSIVDVLTFPGGPFEYAGTAEATASVILDSGTQADLFNVSASGVDPATGEASNWTYQYTSASSGIQTAVISLSGPLSVAIPSIIGLERPADLPLIPEDPSPLTAALALGDEKVGAEVRAQYGDNYMISVEGGYAESLLASDLDVLAVIPDLETTPVWVITYEASSPDLLECQIEEPNKAIVVIDMETGAYIKEFGVGITIPNEPGDNLTFETKLGAGFPNPFSAETTVPFSLVSTGHATLKVFDVLGREVATLVDGAVPAGEQSARWNAAGFPSGVYFVRLTADGTTLTQKLVLQK